MKNASARILSLCAILVGVAGQSGAQIIVPEPPFEPLSIKHLRINVSIDDQASHTEIDQVFVNPQSWDMEGTYLFPLPEEASFSAFSMQVDGEPLAAEILEADEARRIYEDIVRQLIDPGLLEYAGRGAYKARIFPIPAMGEKQIELAYDELLGRDSNIVRYVYPLNTEKFSSEPLEDVSVQMQIHSSSPIKSVYSPSHEIVVDRLGENDVNVIYADEGVRSARDFVLYYTVSQDEVGVDLLTLTLPPKTGPLSMRVHRPTVEARRTSHEAQAVHGRADYPHPQGSRIGRHGR